MDIKNILIAFSISVIAGMLVVTLSIAWRILWYYYIENFYIKISSLHLADISGSWTATYDITGGEWIATDKTTFNQHGYRIDGVSEYTCVKNGTDERKVSRFRLKGILRNDILSGYYYNEDRKKKGSGAFSYNLTNGGNVLSGFGILYNVDTGYMETMEYELTRDT